MFDFEHFDEIYDVLNEIEVARQEDTIRSEKVTQWAAIMGVFLQSLAVGLSNRGVHDFSDDRCHLQPAQDLPRKYQKRKQCPYAQSKPQVRPHAHEQQKLHALGRPRKL